MSIGCTGPVALDVSPKRLVSSRERLAPQGDFRVTFREKLKAASQHNGSLLCVGLDPAPGQMPPMAVFDFNRAIIDATADLVCAYKPNLAFYEALGLEGLEALVKTVAYIPGAIPAIGDAKRGDIGHTAQAYAKAMFEVMAFDAVTVNPYLGYDSIEPFLGYRDRGVFVLCQTSNPSASEFQRLLCWQEGGTTSQPLYEIVAQRARKWDEAGNVGLVVGATYPQELRRLRELCPTMTLLIPGIGPQGGDLEAAVHYGLDARGEGAIFSASRQVLYASRGRDFAVAARRMAQELRNEINRFREEGPGKRGA